MVDALINVNVDAHSNSIISYSDSAYAPRTAQACASRHNPFTSAAAAAAQFVFGTSDSVHNDDGERATEECPVAAAELVDTDKTPIDPRVALANFIIHASPDAVSLYDSLDDLVETMSVSHTLHADSTHPGGAQLTIHGAPGAVSENGVPARLSYVQRPDGKSVALTWSFEYESKENWYEAHISAAHDAEDVTAPLFVVDWVRDAPHGGHKEAQKQKKPVPEPDYSYRVYPWGTNDPSEGKRALLKNPAFTQSSPSGWHKIPQGAGRDSGKKGQSALEAESVNEGGLYSPGWSSNLRDGAIFRDTRGNNVFAQGESRAAAELLGISTGIVTPRRPSSSSALPHSRHFPLIPLFR